MVERTTQKTGSMWRLFVLLGSPTSLGGGYNSPNSSLLGCAGTIADEGYPWGGGYYPTATEVHDATNRLSAGGAFTGPIGQFCSVSAVHTWINGNPHSGGDLNVNDEADIHRTRLSM